MNKERLQQVIRVLRTLPPEAQNAFDLPAGWIAKGGEDWDICNHGHLFDTREIAYNLADPLLIPHNCGATACACGYAGLDLWFNEQGFRTTQGGTVQYGEKQSWGAVEDFFDLTVEESHYLFTGDYDEYVSPDMVATRIELFIKRGGVPPRDDE